MSRLLSGCFVFILGMIAGLYAWAYVVWPTLDYFRDIVRDALM